MRNTKKPMAADCLAILLIILAFAAPPALSQQMPEDFTDVRALPEGVPGERIREIIDVVNANDKEKTRAFVNQRFTEEFRDLAPMERHQDVVSQLYRQSRGFEFYGIRKYKGRSAPGEYVVIVRNKLTGLWAAFVLQLQTHPPHRIAGLQFSSARPPKDLPKEEKVPEEDFPARLEELAKKLAEAELFSGALLLAKDGKVIYKGAFGLASRRFEVPNKVDTKFNLGSMNKMFTSVSIAQLVQKGRLSLEDPLSAYLSTDWLPKRITEKMKIKHLLTHTSGLGSYFNETFQKSSRLLFRKLDDYKPLVVTETLAFEPGTRWSYSNTGMFLLGVVIEKVTGRSYFDYVKEQIYDPAGMTNTGCYEMDKPVPNLAIGYSRDGEGWRNNLYTHVVKGGPAGGGFSTVEDLLKFDQALRNHKLLNEKYTEMVLSAKPELHSPSYGFGFSVQGEPGNRIVGHSGGFAGISSNLDMFLDSGYTAVVMSNMDRGAQALQAKMRELIAQR